jgi:DNA repair ATPase RecN
MTEAWKLFEDRINKLKYLRNKYAKHLAEIEQKLAKAEQDYTEWKERSN